MEHNVRGKTVHGRQDGLCGLQSPSQHDFVLGLSKHDRRRHACDLTLFYAVEEILACYGQSRQADKVVVENVGVKKDSLTGRDVQWHAASPHKAKRGSSAITLAVSGSI